LLCLSASFWFQTQNFLEHFFEADE
jgi:hypothetical protein